MITKEHAVEICRELGFTLNSQHLYYYQIGVMVDPATDGITDGYYYVGWLSPNGSLTPATLVDVPIDIQARLRGASVQGWSAGDMYYDSFNNTAYAMRLVDAPKFCVFDQLDNSRSVPCSFYGYRFKK